MLPTEALISNLENRSRAMEAVPRELSCGLNFGSSIVMNDALYLSLFNGARYGGCCTTILLRAISRM